MFNNFRTCWLYVKSDFARYGRRPTTWNILKAIASGWNHSFSYCFWLRLSAMPNLLYPLARHMHAKLSCRYAIQIYPTTKIGFGLCLGHGVNIIVNPTAIIGNNCNLSHFTTIGSNRGKAAEIGDNVYIGPGVSIIENVKIGNNATIGAGAIVTADVPENATSAGNPARMISYKNPGQYVRNRCNVSVYKLSLPKINATTDQSEISYIDKFIY